MDGDICPPWWPDLLWRLFHRRPGPPPPPWIEDLFVVIAINELAGSLSNEKLGRQIQGVTEQALESAMKSFGG